ncbi:MAG: BatD family protein, partial [Bacteroidales bacterium]|nr:BatD family protein [Bacteroidales bacterium]
APASILIGGKQYKSNAIKIRVIANPNKTQPQGQAGKQQQASGSQGIDSKSLFFKATANKSNPMIGEQINISFKIYTSVNIAQYTVDEFPAFAGFWTQDLEGNKKQPKQHYEVIDGKRYIVAEIHKKAIFPQKSGKLRIDPMKIECLIQVQSKSRRSTGDAVFDQFFNNSFFNSYQNVKKTLKSNSITINVKPLPINNKPAGFSGAVGSFTFTSDLDKTELKANEAINLKFSISGKGNVKLVNKLNVDFPPDFEVYDPKITYKDLNTENTIGGRRSFEYLIIPRNAGSYKIKAVQFSYFDPGKNKYITLSSPEYNINVAKGEGSQTNISYSGVNQEDIKYIGSDIRFIKTDEFPLQIIGSYFFGSMNFYLSIFLPIILFIVFIIVWKNQLRKRSDMLFMKHKKATKISRKRLKKASEYLKQNKKEEFFVEISQALWGYLSDKFAIPLSELSMESVNDALLNKNVNEEIIKQFIDTLNECEFARFAPGDSASTLENIYKQGLEIISKIERELK